MGYTPRNLIPAPQTRARMFTDGSYSQLPDPVRQSAFYDSVTLKRGLAWIVDSIIVAILVFIALAFTAFLGAFFFLAFWMVISFAYRVVTIANGSATWGMRLMAIEFRDWRKLEAGIGTTAWFCDPQAPWQKGTVENTNNRLRNFLPCSTDPTALTNRYLRSICQRLNATPRKCLGYRTPAEVFEAKLVDIQNRLT